MSRHLWAPLLVVLACHAGDDEAETAERPVTVACEAVKSGRVDDVIALRGIVSPPPDRRSPMAPVAAGRLLEVPVKEGQHVDKGAVLAIVESSALAGAYEEADAAVNAAKVAQAGAQTALERANRLFKTGISSQRDVEDAQAHAAAAESDLKSVQARRAVAGKQLERSSLRAPIAGTVTHVFLPPGALVDGTPATPVVEVADLTVLELSTSAPAGDLTRLSVDDVAEVGLDALPAVPVSGKVVAVGPTVDSTSSLGTVRIQLEAPPNTRLIMGLAGVARVTAATHEGALLVPRVAVRRGEEGVDELVICKLEDGKHGKAEIRPVKLGLRSGTDVEIVEGVHAGELVVTEHMLGLADGRAILVEQPPAERAERGGDAGGTPTP